MANPVAEKVRALVEAPIAAAGYEFVDAEWKHDQVGWVCRVFIDGPGGISHADCERVSRELSALLDVHEVIPHAFHLEVSSPGLNRPLRTAEHFRRFVGQRAYVRLRDGRDGRKNFAGVILSVDAFCKTVSLDVDGRKVELPLSDLDRANLEHEFEVAHR